jgi:hypothetical protein
VLLHQHLVFPLHPPSVHSLHLAPSTPTPTPMSSNLARTPSVISRPGSPTSNSPNASSYASSKHSRAYPTMRKNSAMSAQGTAPAV